MNEASETPTPPPVETSGVGKRILFFLATLAVIAFVAVAGMKFLPPYLHSIYQSATSPSTERDIAQIQQRLTGLENSIRAMDDHLNTVSIGSAVAIDQTAKDKEIARLKEDLASLSSSLSNLQSEVKDSAHHAEQGTRNLLASSIAYIRLRTAALTNKPFSKELNSLFDVSSADADMQQIGSKIKEIAVSGAPTTAELREELSKLEANTSVTTEEKKVEHWWDHIVVELKSFVSIHNMRTENPSFAAIHTHLNSDNLDDVLADIKNLPEDAQAKLKEWRAKVEARQSVNDALNKLGDHIDNALKAHVSQKDAQ